MSYVLALKKFRSSPSAQDVNFTIKYYPYQLYPEASKEGEDKYEWYIIKLFAPFTAFLGSYRPRYKKTIFNDSEEQMEKYTMLMSAYGVGVGVDFKFHGLVANTLDAHRLIQYYQEEMGPEVADKIVNCTR